MFRTVVLLAILCCVSSSKHPDEVASLPGLNFPLNYRHYSGYLNATEGKFLHYWFVESQRSPSDDPVLLWLNGGPGCSSLDGFLSEVGPLHASDDGKTLYNNTFSWNREANVLFLESPAGVGFSYSLDKNYETDDDAVSNDNYLALRHFFEKFPQFKKNEFYMAGEGYAGVYLPTLGLRVLNGSSASVNFKGYAIGNGHLDVANMTNGLVFFAYHHGLIGSGLWEKLTQNCCGGKPTEVYCKFAPPPSASCGENVKSVFKIAFNYGLNARNLYADCAASSGTNLRYLANKRSMFKRSDTQFPSTPGCSDSSGVKKYLNRPEVRKALHIPAPVQEWDICSQTVEEKYKMLRASMKPEIRQLAQSGIRGLLYNGDVDMTCNFLGNLWFADDTDLRVQKDYKRWHYDDQVAGFVKYYKKLAYLTIKGSGHMVSKDTPAQALYVITQFLNDERF